MDEKEKRRLAEREKYHRSEAHKRIYKTGKVETHLQETGREYEPYKYDMEVATELASHNRKLVRYLQASRKKKG